MKATGPKSILVIDRQDHWRGISSEALTELGFSVRTMDHYDYSPSAVKIGDEPPHLIILGCASIGHEERALINKILADKHHLLVFCASLPWADMRYLFLAGADDVEDKTYDRHQLANIVKQSVAEIEMRDSYQAVEGKV